MSASLPAAARPEGRGVAGAWQGRAAPGKLGSGDSALTARAHGTSSTGRSDGAPRPRLAVARRDLRWGWRRATCPATEAAAGQRNRQAAEVIHPPAVVGGMS